MAASDIEGRAAFLWLYREWIESKPPHGAIVVEVGVALGRSIAALCEMLDEAGRGDVQVYAVDPWAGRHRNGEQQARADAAGGDFTLYAKEMIEHAPRAFERVRVIRLPSTQAAHLFYRDPLSLVVLDGAHDYMSVREDLYAWEPRTETIGGDDFEDEYPGVKKAVCEYFGERDGLLETRRDQDWGTWRVKCGRARASEVIP
jgi:hypothetical protein